MAENSCRELALDMVRNGATLTDAARHVGVATTTVWGWAKQAGVIPDGRVPFGARERFWLLWAQGFPIEYAAQQAGINGSTGRRWARNAGVARPLGQNTQDVVEAPVVVIGKNVPVLIDCDAPPGYRLTVREREQIALCRAGKMTIRDTASLLKRSPSTISREIARNKGEDDSYRALAAQRVASRRARRPKTSKLAQVGPLRDFVVNGLKRRYSPEGIAARLRLEYPDDPEMRVCHETIYQALYVQARGGLKREVERSLRRGRAYRQSQHVDGRRRGHMPGMVPIGNRPDDVENRVIPGDWEGDLIVGPNSASAVATLVERASRFTMLGYLPADHTAETVRDALIPLIRTLPDQMRKTLTWDQGREMACHFQIAEQAGIDIYFADPHSPWQRGTNENTNGLLRQYMPKGTDLSIYKPADLQAIADELNDRPRKVLGWLKPIEAWHLLLGHHVTISGKPVHLPDTLKPLAQRCVDP